MTLTSLPMQMPELEGSSGPPSPLLWVKEGKGTYTEALELVTKSVGSPFLKSQPQDCLPSWLSPAALILPSTALRWLSSEPDKAVSHWDTVLKTEWRRKPLSSLNLSSHPPKKACKCALFPFFTLAFWFLHVKYIQPIYTHIYHLMCIFYRGPRNTGEKQGLQHAYVIKYGYWELFVNRWNIFSIIPFFKYYFPNWKCQDLNWVS